MKPNSSFCALKVNTSQITSAFAMSSTSMVIAEATGSVASRILLPAGEGKMNSRQIFWLRARLINRCSSFWGRLDFPLSCTILMEETPFTTSMLWISSFTMQASPSCAPFASSWIFRSSSAIRTRSADPASSYCFRYSSSCRCSCAILSTWREMSLVSSDGSWCGECSVSLQLRRRRSRQACCQKEWRKQVKCESLGVWKAGVTLCSSSRSRDSFVWISSFCRKLSQQAPILLLFALIIPIN